MMPYQKQLIKYKISNMSKHLNTNATVTLNILTHVINYQTYIYIYIYIYIHMYIYHSVYHIISMAPNRSTPPFLKAMCP